MEQLLGHHEEADARLRAALDELPEATSPQAVELMLHLAAGEFYRMDYEGMRALGRARAGSGKRAGRAAGRGEPRRARRGGGVHRTDLRSRGPSSRAAALVDALPDDELASRLDAVTNLSAADLYLHRYDDAALHASRGLAIARATGQGDLAPFLIPVLVTVLHTKGRVRRGRRAAHRGNRGRTALGQRGSAWLEPAQPRLCGGGRRRSRTGPEREPGERGRDAPPRRPSRLHIRPLGARERPARKG